MRIATEEGCIATDGMWWLREMKYSGGDTWHMDADVDPTVFSKLANVDLDLMRMLYAVDPIDHVKSVLEKHLVEAGYEKNRFPVLPTPGAPGLEWTIL